MLCIPKQDCSAKPDASRHSHARRHRVPQGELRRSRKNSRDARFLQCEVFLGNLQLGRFSIAQRNLKLLSSGWEDHIKNRWTIEFHYLLENKHNTIKEAMKSQDAQATVDTKMGQTFELASLGLQERHNAEAVRQANVIKYLFIFASVMDLLCHLKHAEFAKHLQNNGRVVLWVDNVKDDNAYCAVVTDQSA